MVFGLEFTHITSCFTRLCAICSYFIGGRGAGGKLSELKTINDVQNASNDPRDMDECERVADVIET